MNPTVEPRTVVAPHSPPLVRSSGFGQPDAFKRLNPERPPVLSFCLIVRNASKTLETCLKSIRAFSPDAEIVVVDTMSSDDSPAIAMRYADIWEEYRGPKGDWTREMFAFDDAAAARNRSFELATGKYVGWIDADDELVTPAETQRLLAANGRLPPADGTKEVKGLQTQREESELGQRRVASFEEYLSVLPADGPEVFVCPYLYRFTPGEEASGKALEWQMRERIIRRGPDGKLPWKWHRKAHEYLAPNGPFSRGARLPTVLFVHRKEWNAEDIAYSEKRHWNIVFGEYNAGKRVPFDLFYLCRSAKSMAPELERTFIDEYVKATIHGADRSQALSVKAAYLAREGFFHEAVECYVAAVAADDTYSEPRFGLAKVYEDADRWLDAAKAYEAGVACSPDHPYSALSPREHLVVNRIKAAVCYWKASKQLLDSEPLLQKAALLAKAAGDEPGAMVVDAAELQAYVNLFQNELTCFRTLKSLAAAAQVLIINDETFKAAQLADSVPHNMADHPLAQQMAMHKAKIDLHGSDPEAYQQFYEQIGTDRFTDEEELQSALLMPRIQFLLTQLKKLRADLDRPLRVLEIGPWDGISLIHAMEALPDSQFVGIEVKQTAIDELQKRVAARGWSDRLKMVHGPLTGFTRNQAMGLESGEFPVSGEGVFDAIVFYEVIEHLPRPEDALDLLLHALDPKGRLFVSTPWGAFDRGHPADFKTRDVRGHVHAFTPLDVVDLLGRSAFKVLETGGYHGEGHFGDTFHLMAVRCPIVPRAFSPQFVVPGALWDWNATTVETTGMGASEETIVYLAREMSKRNGVPLVFGPVPKAGILDAEEVRDGVQYWSREKLRYLDSDLPVIVSRAPAFGKQLKELLPRFSKDVPKRMFLWLQDCFYPDLNAEVAMQYEKIIVLSHYHREQMAAQGVPLDKMKIIPNFILREHFPDVPSKVGTKREPHRFIYCSSPDRGLLPLLRMWPLFRKQWPDATLGIFYGWEGAKRLGATMPAWIERYRPLREEYNALKRQDGIEEYGRVNHYVIAYEMRRASVWPYPCLNTEVETFCSNAVKARAAGCVPVCTPVGALPVTAFSPVSKFVSIDPKQPLSDFEWAFFKSVREAVENTTDEQRDQMAREAIETYELGAVMPKWEELLR